MSFRGWSANPADHGDEAAHLKMPDAGKCLRRRQGEYRVAGSPDPTDSAQAKKTYSAGKTNTRN
jgi:hypothetical protein